MDSIYFSIIRLIKLILAKYLMLYAKLTARRFYCLALQGDSVINRITLKSDLTVSCNCSDTDGTGKIGDSKLQNLASIFSGHKASFFRKSLANGKLPILNCISCKNLCWIEKNALKNIYIYRLPKKIYVENTAYCNLRCLSCNRKAVLKNRDKKLMDFEDMRLVSNFIKQADIKSIAYLNQGEPFFSSTIKQEIEIIKKENPQISLITSTNGLLFDTKDKFEAALYFDHICFSIHGSTQESAAKYQKGGDFQKAYANMKSVIELRNSKREKKPVIEWKYILFRWNDSPALLSQAIRLAQEVKVDILSFRPTCTPWYGISYRYYLGRSYWKKIGSPCRKGREIDFR